MLKKVFLVAVALIVGIVLCGWFALSWYTEASKNDDAFFESEILAFEKSDMQNFPKSNEILFVGSSSIRLWETLADDMAPLPVIQRGFGGAHMSHVLYNFERIITPYKPKAVVIFVGGNDVGSGKTAQRLISDYRGFIARFEKELPDADLWILSMKPSRLRWELRGEMQKVDDAFRAFSAANDKITFVESGRVLLDADGEPDDVYRFDGLHLNEEGYRRWTKLLKPLLLEEYSSE